MKKKLDIVIPPEVASEMYQFFLRTSAPRLAAKRKEEDKRAKEKE